MKKTTIIIALVAMSTIFPGQSPAEAAASKPGTAVQATSKEKLIVGEVGFTDESYCTGNYQTNSTSSYACNESFRDSVYVTTWAVSVKNTSPTRSAAQVRVQLTFLNVSGTILQQNIVGVAREIKPGKVVWAASNSSYSDASLTGVTQVLAKIVGNSWIVPSKSIYQTPILLDFKPGQKYFDHCQLNAPCSFKNGQAQAGALTYGVANGIFTLRGPAGYFNTLVIFLNPEGRPIGGWSYVNQSSFTTGSQDVRRAFTQTDFEIGNIASYLFVVQQ
jgi:hypothetical protein